MKKTDIAIIAIAGIVIYFLIKAKSGGGYFARRDAAGGGKAFPIRHKTLPSIQLRPIPIGGKALIPLNPIQTVQPTSTPSIDTVVIHTMGKDYNIPTDPMRAANWAYGGHGANKRGTAILKHHAEQIAADPSKWRIAGTVEIAAMKASGLLPKDWVRPR